LPVCCSLYFNLLVQREKSAILGSFNYKRKVLCLPNIEGESPFMVILNHVSQRTNFCFTTNSSSFTLFQFILELGLVTSKYRRRMSFYGNIELWFIYGNFELWFTKDRFMIQNCIILIQGSALRFKYYVGFITSQIW